MGALSDSFLRSSRRSAPPPGLEPLLEEGLARAQREWPGVTVDPAAFLEELGARLKGQPPAAETLPDVYLAFAASRGQRAAVAHFEKSLMPIVRRTARRLVKSDDALEEIEQQIRVRFLVGDKAQPATLSTYEGKGPLRNWLIGKTLWLARDLKRSTDRFASGEEAELELGHLSSEELPAEVVQLRRAHRGVLQRAFREALGALPAQDRTVMRMYFVDEVSLDGIGKLYGVNRSTVSRWLKRAREQLLETVERDARRELKLSGRALQSLVRAVRSELQLGLSTLLKSEISRGRR